MRISRGKPGLWDSASEVSERSRHTSMAMMRGGSERGTPPLRRRYFTSALGPAKGLLYTRIEAYRETNIDERWRTAACPIPQGP